MKYLLLGGSGFIGSHLAKKLALRHHVVVTGRSLNSKITGKNIIYKQLDFTTCTDFKKYIKDVDVIVHMISTTVPSEDITHVKEEITDNVLPTISLLDAAAKLHKRVVFISSGGTIYGKSLYLNREIDGTDPICNYGIMKLMIEKYLALYGNNCGLKYTILRLSNPYSETVYHSKKQGVIPIIVENALINKPLVVYGDGQIRDFIYIDDLIDGMMAALQYKGEQKIFNIGTGVGYTVNEVIKIIEKKLGKKIKIKKVSARRCDVKKNVLDISVIHRETGWRPKISLENGISRIIASQINNGGDDV